VIGWHLKLAFMVTFIEMFLAGLEVYGKHRKQVDVVIYKFDKC